MPKVDKSSKQRIAPIAITILILLLLLICIGICTSYSDFMQTIEQINMRSEFPISGTTHSEQIENSDLHFKYHGHILTILSVVIAFIAAILTFAAFYIQYNFNKSQHNDLARERCENQFFHLMDVYRDMCKSNTLQGVGNNKVLFHYMFYEYKALFYLLKNKIIKNSETAIPDLIHFVNENAFNLFINGVSENFSLTCLSKEYSNILDAESIKKELLNYQKSSLYHGIDKTIDAGVVYLSDYKGNHIKYFDGHRVRLIPYFNFIFLILEFIATNKEAQQASFDALKYLITELSEHEIGLIYAYSKHKLYKESSKSNLKLDNLLNRIFESLPIDTSDKFKFDKKGFISTLQ